MSKIFSIVVPVYQNEANLHDTVPKLCVLQDRLPEYRLEIVFVDDGSRDRSFEILSGYAKQFPELVSIVKLTRNFGQTPAIQAGLRQARGDCVGVISADLQEPHELFVDMLREWEVGARFVIGEREAREESAWHQAVSSIYWRLIRRFAFADFPKLGYDFCLLDRQVVDDINRINEKNSSIFVLVYWLGYHPVRLPITRKERAKGRSQWSIWRKFRFTLDTLIGFTYVPARFITVMGFVMAFLCFIFLLVMVVQWFWLRTAPPGWMSLVGLLSLLGAMLLFSIGLLSEYLVRILDEARKRPPYVVDRVIVHGEAGDTDRHPLAGPS